MPPSIQPQPSGRFFSLYDLWLYKAELWWDWHNANPLVWKFFEQFAFEALRRGKKKTSHWLLMNRVRWEVYITTTGYQGKDGEEFKIGNDHIAFYARYWKVQYPQYSYLMTTKLMIGEPPGSPWVGST
jgi:hypothetical protein